MTHAFILLNVDIFNLYLIWLCTGMSIATIGSQDCYLCNSSTRILGLFRSSPGKTHFPLFILP